MITSAADAIQVSTDGADTRYLTGTTPISSSVLAVLGGTQLTSNATWLSSGAPYLLEANLTVPVSTSLTIPAPVTMQFSGSSIYVAGTLNMTGTATQPITLTTANASAAPGQWGGIAFQPGSSGKLTYVHLSDGGNYLHDHTGNGAYYTNMLIEGSNPTVISSTFDTSYGSGVEIKGSAFPTFDHDIFGSNLGQYAVQVDDNTSLATLTNDIFNGANIQVSTDGANAPTWRAVTLPVAEACWLCWAATN